MERADSAQTPEQVFAARVKAARQDQGLTQEELGKRLGVGRTTILRLERGEKQPTIRDLFEMAAALNVSPVHLLMPLEDDNPVEIGGRVMTARNARAWTRGQRLRRGADLPAFTRQMPDRELRALVEAVLAESFTPLTWALVDPDKREAAVQEYMDAIRNFTREEQDDA